VSAAFGGTGEVDHGVGALVTATLVTGGHAAVVVTATSLG